VIRIYAGLRSYTRILLPDSLTHLLTKSFAGCPAPWGGEECMPLRGVIRGAGSPPYPLRRLLLAYKHGAEKNQSRGI